MTEQEYDQSSAGRLRLMWLAGFTPEEARAKWGAGIEAVRYIFAKWDEVASHTTFRVFGDSR